MKVCADELNWNGRYLDYNGIRYFDYSSSGFSFVLKGNRAVTKIVSDCDAWSAENYAIIAVYISEGIHSYWEDFPEEPTKIFELSQKVTECLLFDAEGECTNAGEECISEGECTNEGKSDRTVTIRVVKLSEAAFGCAGFESLEVEGEILPLPKTESKKIEFVGDSITCGYGIDGKWSMETYFSTQTERADKSFAFLTAKNLNAEFQCCSRSGIGIISHYVDPATINLPDIELLMQGLWPYTDKLLSLRMKIEPEVWNEKRFSPDIIVINLGTNDNSWVRGIEDRRLSYVSGYRLFLEEVHRRSPNAKICCCLGIMGQELCDSVTEAVSLFKKDFPHVQTKIVKFPVQKDEDGIAIDWHPSAKTQKLAANQLTQELKNW